MSLAEVSPERLNEPDSDFRRRRLRSDIEEQRALGQPNGLAHLPSDAGKIPSLTSSNAGKARRIPSERSEVRCSQC